jgi:glycosyltransferase involved in cell wall biosynthesis
MTLVSVVVPTRDRPRLVACTLRSVLAQRDVELEVIVVDDGSSPPLATVEDPRVRLVRHTTSRGVSAARNAGIAVASGEWVAFCDDDDVWAPNKLAAQLSAAAELGASWVYTGDVTVDEDLRILGGGPPLPPRQVVALLSRYNAVPGSASSVMIAAVLLASAGGFDTARVFAEDWDMWLRLARRAPPAAVSRPLVALRRHRGNTSRHVQLMLHEVECVARSHNIQLDIAKHLRWAAWLQLQEGRRGTAVAYYLRAVATGDLRSLGRVAVVLSDRRLIDRRRPLVDRGWTDQAQDWLRALRAPG